MDALRHHRSAETEAMPETQNLDRSADGVSTRDPLVGHVRSQCPGSGRISSKFPSESDSVSVDSSSDSVSPVSSDRSAVGSAVGYAWGPGAD